MLALTKVSDIVLAEATSQLDRSELKLTALANIRSNFTPEVTFHDDRSEEKLSADSNMDVKSLT
jgi:ribosome-binding factor A